MTDKEFEIRTKEIASNLQILLDEMRQLHDWIVLNPIKDVTMNTAKEWEDGFYGLKENFLFVGHAF